jgi:hypothetical protein
MNTSRQHSGKARIACNSSFSFCWKATAISTPDNRAPEISIVSGNSATVVTTSARAFSTR